MIRSLLLLSPLLPVPAHHTFDPSVQSVVADGSTRLGDPSPFSREGYEERGFIVIQASKPKGCDPMVQVSLIKQPDRDDPAKALGRATFLPLDKAGTLATEMARGDGLEKAVEV